MSFACALCTIKALTSRGLSHKPANTLDNIELNIGIAKNQRYYSSPHSFFRHCRVLFLVSSLELSLNVKPLPKNPLLQAIPLIQPPASPTVFSQSTCLRCLYMSGIQGCNADDSVDEWDDYIQWRYPSTGFRVEPLVNNGAHSVDIVSLLQQVLGHSETLQADVMESEALWDDAIYFEEEEYCKEEGAFRTGTQPDSYNFDSNNHSDGGWGSPNRLFEDA